MAPKRRQPGARGGRAGAGAPTRVAGSALTPGTTGYFVTVLRNATRTEIADILKQIGYRPPTAPPRPSAEQVSTALNERVRSYLGTPEGRAELDRRRAELVNEQASRYLTTNEGRKRAENVFAHLVAGQIAEDDDLLNRLCRDAAMHEVEIWLNSHRGRKTVDSPLERAIDERVLEWVDMDRKDWIRKTLRELNNGEGQA